MKSTALIGVMVLTGLLGACATPGYREGDDASAAMRAAADESKGAQGHIDAAWRELDALHKSKEGDLRPVFDRFAANVDALQKSIDELDTQTHRMSAEAKAYMDRWVRELREVKNEDLRRKSEQRRVEVEERVRKVTELSGQTRTKALACLSDLSDVRRVLGTDLTQGGIATVQDGVARARASSAALREEVVKLAAELEALGKDVASPPTEEPKKAEPAKAEPKKAEPTK